MANTDVISAEKLREVLQYDQDAGVFRWKTSHQRSLIGKEVGSWDLYGYKTVRINYKSYKLHRLAWLYVTGEWPNGDIDHINGVRHDNRLSNLRDVCRETNLQNMRDPKNNQSTGVLGVYPQKKRFCAKISIQNKSMHLGSFATIDEAHHAYLAAKRRLHDGCTI